MTEDDSLPPTIELRAFGQRLQLAAPRSAFLRADALWRMKTHYGPALAARSLDGTGVALDIGAGFGAFALPFALAFPGWTVFAFEPDAQSFAALRENARALGATNLVALPLAVADLPPPDDPDTLLMTLGDLLYDAAGSVAALIDLLPRQDFAAHLADHGFLQPGPAPSEAFATLTLPAFPAALLSALQPNLLKLTAPLVESAVFEAMRDVALDHILGERWTHVDSTLAAGQDRPGRRECWLPLAGPELLTLRNGPQVLRRGLDVVVAMYNSAPFIEDCIRGLVARDHVPLRVLVVDDGSTDDSAQIVRRAFGADPRVVLLSKSNGGCASARNCGRMMSDASHIAFVDADDLPDADLFPDLYELARQTGAEVVQGGFHLVEQGPGGLTRRPGPESDLDLLREAKRHVIGARTCALLPNWVLMTGQPTIWRRVYRRDFLDNRRIWFPEHIRAFDDQIFQLLTLQPIPNVPVLDGPSYGYRQHPGQDIRQKDERHFYSLEMFRMALRRGLADGWHDFRPLLRAFVNTVNWVTGDLRPDLTEPFVAGAAELWAIAGKIVGPKVMEDFPDAGFTAPDIARRCAEVAARLADLPQSAAYVFLDSPQWQVPMVRMPWERVGA